jgi:hypothetical protein
MICGKKLFRESQDICKSVCLYHYFPETLVETYNLQSETYNKLTENLKIFVTNFSTS